MDPLTDRKTYRTNMTPSHLKSLKRTSLLSFFFWLCDRPLILGEALEIIFLTKGPSLRSTSEPSQTLSVWRRRKFLATKPSLWMSTSGEWEMFAKHVREFIRAKPDVIHYVDSPEISSQAKGQKDSRQVSGNLVAFINDTYWQCYLLTII